LFSARVTQHMLIFLFATPFIGAACRTWLIRRDGAGHLTAATAGVALCMWFWHSPLAYDSTLTDNRIYWAMQISSMAIGIWFWSALSRANGFAAFLAVSITGVQMSLLGAVLTFARSPLFVSHLLTTGAWGITPLQDQQLGGLIMWVPAGLVLTAGSVAALASAVSKVRAYEPSQAS
jgi:putative membrane protein